MEQEPLSLTDKQRAIAAANRIRSWWKDQGFEVKVEVKNDGSIISDMVNGRPSRRLQHL